VSDNDSMSGLPTSSGRHSWRALLAIVLVAIVVAGGLAAFLLRPHHKAPPKAIPITTINVIGGSEKTGFITDPQVTARLKQLGIAVHWKAMGSIAQAEMTPSQLKGIDALWPGSLAAEYLFESHTQGDFPAYHAQEIFSSPEVLYSGPETTKVLMAHGIVREEGSQYYIVDMVKLFQLIRHNATWQSLGSTISGPIGIDSTDPADSNSGFIMGLLELQTMATGNPYTPPTAAQAHAAIPEVWRLNQAQGLQASSSAYGFQDWNSAGGEYNAPLYAGYESQIIGLWNQSDPDQRAKILQKIRILYPEPTMDNAHVMLALTAAGNKLIQALQDPKIQQIAWARYGFRPLAFGAANVATFAQLHLAQSLRTINPPDAEIISALNTCFQSSTCS
jgi:hypothetical protein